MHVRRMPHAEMRSQSSTCSSQSIFNSNSSSMQCQRTANHGTSLLKQLPTAIVLETHTTNYPSHIRPGPQEYKALKRSLMNHAALPAAPHYSAEHGSWCFSYHVPSRPSSCKQATRPSSCNQATTHLSIETLLALRNEGSLL